MKNILSIRAVCLAGCALIVSGTPALAQTTTETPPSSAPQSDQTTAADDVGPEIVVTARRRNEFAVDVPMSIAAVSGDALAKAGVTSMHDLSNIVSGVQINFAGCCTQPAIRGISTLTTGIGYENNVALYVDGFYAPDNVSINADLTNIASIEVLKGPQGTLWGRNATGGAILINTLAPSKVWTGKVGAGYGRFNDYNVNGYLSGPISENVRIGIAGYHRRSDGYNKLLSPTGTPVANVTPAKQDSVRVKLVADLGNLTATFGYNYGLSSDGRGNLFTIVARAPASITPAPPRAAGPFVFSGGNNLTTVAANTNEGTMKLVLKTGIGTISSYTGFARRFTTINYDFDDTYVDLSSQHQHWQQNTFQQTLEYNIDALAGVDFTVGGSFYKDKIFTDPGQYSFGGGVINGIFTTTLRAESLAGYVDGTWKVTDKLSISAGGRYTHEIKRGEFRQVNGSNVLLATASGRTTFSAFTPRASIRYEIAPKTNAYISYSQGFRSGGWPAGGASSAALYIPFKPEKIKAYEIGFKTEQRMFRFSTAFFYYDYRDLQVGATVPNPNGIPGNVVNITSNATAARVYGIDGDLSAQLSSEFSIHVGGAWLHGRYTDFPNATGTGINIATGFNVTSQTQNWTGLQMTRAPDFSGVIGADYTIKNVGGGELALNANAHYTSSYITNNASVFGPLAGPDLARVQRYKQGAYVLLNLQANWTDESGKIHLGVFANNVTNKIYRLTYSGGGFGDYSSFAPPRTYGVKIGYDF